MAYYDKCYTELLDDCVLHTGLSESVVRAVFVRLKLDDRLAFAFGLAGKSREDYEDEVNDIQGSLDELRKDIAKHRDTLGAIIFHDYNAENAVQELEKSISFKSKQALSDLWDELE